ncbi:MAG: hypothetical protein K8L99_15025 [Anaerolineae bacterium]|nr:hypothetical protein [Anaerolineae bacterium]
MKTNQNSGIGAVVSSVFASIFVVSAGSVAAADIEERRHMSPHNPQSKNLQVPARDNLATIITTHPVYVRHHSFDQLVDMNCKLHQFRATHK